MGKISNTYAALPTHKLRPKAWARAIKFALLDSEDDGNGSCAHLIDELIKSKIKYLENPAMRATLNSRVRERGREFVSKGRWTAWWNGTKPDPAKIEIINLLVPNSREWFSSRPGVNPIQNFLYAIDLLAGDQDSSQLAIQLLLKINSDWRPRAIVESTGTWQMRLGWYIPNLTEDTVPTNNLPSDLATEHYRPLEPASIIEAMLWSGHYLGIEKSHCFLKWVFDLITAAIATKAFISCSDFDMNDFGGVSNDLASMLMDLFINKHSWAAANRPQFVRHRCAPIKAGIPPDESFLQLLVKASVTFHGEIHRYGIEANDIQNLASRKMFDLK